MTHLFRQMYSDDPLNLKKQFTRNELTAVITVELTEKELQRFGFNTLRGELCSRLYFCCEAKT